MTLFTHLLVTRGKTKVVNCIPVMTDDVIAREESYYHRSTSSATERFEAQNLYAI